jgi:hypothetical protein
MSSPSCGQTLPKTWVYWRTRWVDTAGGSPAPDWIAHPAKPGFILKHQPQRLVWVANRNGVHFGLKFF